MKKLNEGSNEYEVLKRLSNSKIPKIYDFINKDNKKYIVLEYFTGCTLKKIVSLYGFQNQKKVISWAVMVCDILCYLHSNSICKVVHCDIKPENIILTNDNDIKLIDFDNSIYLLDNHRCLKGFNGTPSFAAPEQFVNGSNYLDQRTDIYSLGKVLTYLLTRNIDNNIINTNPNVHHEFIKIIKKCTEYLPNKRYNNAKDLKEDLQKLSFLVS